MKKMVLAACFVLLLSGSVISEEPPGVQTEVLAKSGSSWAGSNLTEYPRGNPEITILKITIPAGSRLPLHKHPVINAGVLLSGQLTVITDDNRTLQLKAGDSIIEVVDKWHYGTNEGDVPAQILVFYAGVKDRPITVRNGLKSDWGKQ